MLLQCSRRRRPGFDPWVGKIPWKRKQQPIPIFLPGESHGQRSLVGYSPWGHKESDMTEHTHDTPGLDLTCAQARPAAPTLVSGPLWVALLSCDSPVLPVLYSLYSHQSSSKVLLSFMAWNYPEEVTTRRQENMTRVLSPFCKALD